MPKQSSKAPKAPNRLKKRKKSGLKQSNKKKRSKSNSKGRPKSDHWITDYANKNFYFLEHKTKTWDIVLLTELKSSRESKKILPVKGIRYIEAKSLPVEDGRANQFENAKNIFAVQEGERELLVRVDNWISHEDASEAANKVASNKARGHYKEKIAYIKNLARLQERLLKDESMSISLASKSNNAEEVEEIEASQEEVEDMREDEDDMTDSNKGDDDNNEESNEDIQMGGLGVRMAKVSYPDEGLRAQKDDLVNWCDKAFCGTTYLPVTSLISPAEDIEARELDEDFVDEIAEGIRDLPMLTFMCHVVIRTTTDWWSEETSKDKPRSTSDVKRLIKNGRISTVKYPFEVIAGHHRSKAILRLHKDDETDPMFKRVKCLVYLSVNADDDELIGAYGDHENYISHNVRKTTIFDVVKRYRVRYTRAKRKFRNLTVTSFMKRNVLHFSNMTSSLRLGKGSSTFRFIMKLAMWSERDFSILRKFLKPPAKGGWRGADTLGWFTCVPNMEAHDYTKRLVKIMRQDSKYTVKDMLRDLRHQKWCMFITDKITKDEAIIDSNVKSFEDVQKKYNLPSSFPMSTIQNLQDVLKKNTKTLPNPISEKLAQLKAVHRFNSVNIEDCVSVVDNVTNTSIKLFVYEPQLTAKLMKENVYGLILYDATVMSILHDKKEEQLVAEFLKDFKTNSSAASLLSYAIAIRTNSIKAQEVIASHHKDCLKEFVYSYDRSYSVRANDLMQNVDEYVIIRHGNKSLRSMASSKSSHLRHNFFMNSQPTPYKNSDKKSAPFSRHSMFIVRLLKRYCDSDEKQVLIVGGVHHDDILGCIQKKKNLHVVTFNNEYIDKMETGANDYIGREKRCLSMGFDVEYPKGHPMSFLTKHLCRFHENSKAQKEDNKDEKDTVDVKEVIELTESDGGDLKSILGTPISSTSSSNKMTGTPASIRTASRIVTRRSPAKPVDDDTSNTPSSSVTLTMCGHCQNALLPDESSRKCHQCNTSYHSLCSKGLNFSTLGGKFFCHPKCRKRFSN